MKKFTVDERYNHIGIGGDVHAIEFDEIWNWCYNKPEAYECYATGVVYKTKQDLTMFMLRWL